MSCNRLKLNGDKTELTIFRTPTMSRNITLFPSLSISNSHIDPQTCCRNLGAYFDERLCMDIHVQNICKASYFHLRNIASIRSYLDLKTTESLVHAFIFSKIDYCNSLLFGISKQHIHKLQKLQNRAARVCFNIPRNSMRSSLSLLAHLHWLPIPYRIEFKILLLTYKCIHGIAPQYLSSLLDFLPSTRSRRSHYQALLLVPRSRTKGFGDRSFSVAAPRLWNSLPVSIRLSESVAGFKKSLKTHLFKLAFNS